MKKYIYQTDTYDCGAAALSTILHHYGTSLSLSKIRDLTHTKKNGTTALGIVKAARSLNINADAYQADINSIKENEEKTFPFIAHIVKNKTLLHYYVVLEINDDNIIIFDPDPQVGKKSMSIEKFVEEWSGVCIFFSPTKKYTPSIDKKTSLWVKTNYILKYKAEFITIFIITIITTIGMLASTFLIQSIIDNLIPSKNIQSSYKTLILAGIIFMSLVIFISISNLLKIKLSQSLMKDINMNYILSIFRLPIPFFKDRESGDFISRFNDSNYIANFIGNILIQIFFNIIVSLIIFIILFIISPFLSLISLSIIPLMLLVIFSFYKKLKYINNKVMEGNAKVNTNIIESVEGIETIKSLNSEQNFYKKILNAYNSYLFDYYNQKKIENFQNISKYFFIILLNMTLILIGSRLMLKNLLTLGELTTIFILSNYLFNLIEDIMSAYPQIISAQISNNRLNDIIDYPIKNGNINQIDHNNKPLLKLTNVSYEYDYGNKVLYDINLEINAFEKIGLFGHSGSGKSTLGKIISRYDEITDGYIKYKNIEINNLDINYLRKKIHYLPQKSYTFTGTILENLKLGLENNLSMETISKVCKIAEIDEVINQLPLGYNTHITSTGMGLSGGQLQRLHLARALLLKPNILILDEVTSSLDKETEIKVVNNLLSLTDITIIFISHNENIIKKFNRVLHLENGKIIEVKNKI